MYREILFSILRGILAFLILMIVTRIMGRRTISQITFFDFVVGITLGTLGANIGTGTRPTPVNVITVLLTLAALGMFTAYLHTKSMFIRKLVNSEPIVLIENGEIIKDNLQKSRLSLNDLTSMLRQKNAFNIADVEFAILENEGKISVQPKSQKQPITPSDLHIPTTYRGLTKELIIDGNVMNENLEDVNLDEQWLYSQLEAKGISDIKDVFFAALDTEGNLYVSRGIEGKEGHNRHGIE